MNRPRLQRHFELLCLVLFTAQDLQRLLRDVLTL